MNPIYLMMTGYSLSGKTFLVNKIIKKFPKTFYIIDTRSIHDYLNKYDIFLDDNAINGRAYNMRQDATDTIQRDLITVITKNGYSIVHDSCNRIKKEREETLKLVKEKSPDIKTVIIYVNTGQDIVKKRSQELDKKVIEIEKKEPVWEKLIDKQIETYEKPSKDECDYYLEYNGKNEAEIISSLSDILK